MLQTNWIRSLVQRDRKRPLSRRHTQSRRQLAVELLEERRLLAAVAQLEYPIPGNASDSLRFTGNFELDGLLYSSTDTVYVGFAPKVGEQFHSLLSFSDGTVYLPEENSAVNDSFGFIGTVGLATIAAEPAIFVSPDDYSAAFPVEIDFAVLAATGSDPGFDISQDPLSKGAQTITTADLPFQISQFRLDNPDAGMTTDSSRVDLQGNLSFDKLKLNGLQLGVFGNNHVYVNDGITLDGANFQYSKSFTTAGGTFASMLGVSYSIDKHRFAFTGGGTYASNDKGVSTVQVVFGNAENPGLVVENGKLIEFSISISTTPQNHFNIWSLSVSTKNLTLSYNIEDDRFHMYGELDVDRMGSGVQIKMGTRDDPGLVVSHEKGVENVNMSVSGKFTLIGVTIEIPTGDPLTFKYDKAAGEYDISGAITVPQFFSATTTLGTASQPGLKIKNGDYVLDAFSLSLQDVNLGVFTFKKFAINYSVDEMTGDTTYGVTLAIKFPKGWEFDAQITIVNDKIHEIFVKYESSPKDLSTRVPIFNTGLFITEIDVTFSNLDDKDKVLASGHMIFEYGDPITIFGEEVQTFRADGRVTIDGKMLSLEGDAWLGASTENGKTSGLLGKGTVKIELDWHDEIYSVDMHASMVDGTYTFDATFEINNHAQLWVSGHAAVNVPHSVPLIGGEKIASMDFRLAIDPKDSANSYVAAWTRVNLIFSKPAIGVEYLFKKKELKVIGSHDVNKIKHDPFNDDNDSSVFVYSADFDVPLGATSGAFSVDFPSNSGSRTLFVTPPGGTETEVNASTSGTNGMTWLGDLNTDTSLNFSVVDPSYDPSTTTAPPSVLLPTGKYTIKLKSKDFEFANPTAPILAITNDGSGYTKLSLDPNNQIYPDASDIVRGVQVGNTISVAGSVSGSPNGMDNPYNTEHTITWVSADGLTWITDQTYDNSFGDGLSGTVKGWQQPVFSAAFHSPPPTVVIQDFSPNQSGGVLVLESPVFEFDVYGTVDLAFAKNTTLDLYFDRDGSGYDGVLLASKVPTDFSSGNFSSMVQADVSDLITGDYYLYAVVNDGTNTPVYSSYSSAFVPQHFVTGTISNQQQLPLPGVTVYADLNKNGSQDANEAVSQPSNSSGIYQFSEDAIPYAPVTFTTDGEYMYAFFPDHSHGLHVGDKFLITDNPVEVYNQTYTVTYVWGPGYPTYVKTNVVPHPGEAAGPAHAQIQSLTGELPSVRNIQVEDGTGRIFVEFAAPHKLKVGDRFLVNSPLESGYVQAMHQVTELFDETQVYTDQSDKSIGQYFTATTLAKSIADETDLNVGITSFPAGYAPGADGGYIEHVSYNAEVNFSVNENAVIRGNVFTDLTHDGIRVASNPIQKFDFGTATSPVQAGYTKVTGDTRYSSTQEFGWIGSVGSFDRTSSTGNPVQLTQDGNFGPDITFQTDLSNGVYDVTLYYGDPLALHDYVAVSLQGGQLDSVTTVTAQFLTRTYSDVLVANGTLTLQLTSTGGDNGDAVIDGMSITRSDDPSIAGWTVQLLSSDEQLIQTTLSATDGSYRFGNVVPGDYSVKLIPANGSTATYSFDASTVSAGTVADISGSGQSSIQVGTLRNGASVGTASSFAITDHPHAAPANQILHVNGSNQFVEVQRNSNLEPGTGAFSFAGWIRVDHPTRRQDIAGVNDQNNQNDGWAFTISQSTSQPGKLSVLLRERGSGAPFIITAGSALQADTWYHVAFSYDPTIADGSASFDPAAVQIYVNGELQTSRIVNNNSLPPNPDIGTANAVNLNIGARGTASNGTSFYFGGYIDDASIWGSALSPLEVLALVNGATSPSYALVSPTPLPVTIANSVDIQEKLDFAVDELLAITGTIEGSNLNSRNILDPEVHPQSNWTVKLLNSDGSQVFDPLGNPVTALSQSDGRYIFPQVPTGSYLIEEVVPAGWKQTSPFESVVSFSDPIASQELSLSSSVTTADFDLDGNLDIATVLSTGVSNEFLITYGHGDGTFLGQYEYIANVNSPIAMLAVFDFDGKGVPSLAVIGQSGEIALLQNNAMQSPPRSNLFTQNTPAGWQLPGGSEPVDFVVGDFDRDSRQDIVISRSAVDLPSSVISEFDFGTSSSPVESGYKRVDGGTSYSTSKGYGWDNTSVTSGTDQGSHVDPTKLTGDGVHGQDMQFRVDVPNGIYNIGLFYGQKNGDRETNVYLQGESVDTVTTNAGVYSAATYHGIVISDGQLIVRLVGDATRDAQINGLAIKGSSGITFLPGDLSLPPISQALQSPLAGGIAVGYIDDDPFLDLALNEGNKPLVITAALGAGNGSFSTFKSIPAGNSDIVALESGGPVSLVDANRDGLLDVVYPEGGAFMSGLFLDASGNIQSDVTGFGVYAGAAAQALKQIVTDVNGDLYPDIVLLPKSTTTQSQDIRVFVNRGDGNSLFESPQTFGQPTGVFTDLVVSDVNGDGLPDLIAIESIEGAKSRVLTYLNQSTPTNTRIPVDLLSGMNSSGNDFNNGQIGQFYGTVFDDTNGNSLRNLTETPLGGVTVYLDSNNNGQFDHDSEVSTTTDTNGSYTFSGLADGTHRIRMVDDANRFLTTPRSGGHQVTVARDAPMTTGELNFGTASNVIMAIADRVVRQGQSFTFAVPQSNNPTSGSPTFSLASDAPQFASIDPDTGIFHWDDDARPSVYLVSIAATSSLIPTLTQHVSFHVSVTTKNHSLPIQGTDGDDMIALNDDNLVINGSTIDITGVRAIELFSGYGNDEVRLNVDGKVGPRKINVYDPGGNETYIFNTSHTQIAINDQGGVDTLDFSALDSGVKVNLNNRHGRTQQIGRSHVGLRLQGIFENVIGTDYGDTITGNSANNLINSGDGNDVIHGLRGDDKIHGQAGDDRIFGGPGADMIWGGSGRDELRGGNGTDILIGGEDADKIRGDRGRDILIGGTGPDKLLGGKGDDLLIAGTTSFDPYSSSLLAILSEWTSSRSYSERISNIRGSSDSPSFAERENGNIFFTANSTVFDDGNRDTLNGQTGRDWFFAQIDKNPVDRIWRQLRNEEVELLFGSDEN